VQVRRHEGLGAVAGDRRDPPVRPDAPHEVAVEGDDEATARCRRDIGGVHEARLRRRDAIAGARPAAGDGRDHAVRVDHPDAVGEVVDEQEAAAGQRRELAGRELRAQRRAAVAAEARLAGARDGTDRALRIDAQDHAAVADQKAAAGQRRHRRALDQPGAGCRAAFIEPGRGPGARERVDLARRASARGRQHQQQRQHEHRRHDPRYRASIPRPWRSPARAGEKSSGGPWAARLQSPPTTPAARAYSRSAAVGGVP
jgi:hypothetical protein